MGGKRSSAGESKGLRPEPTALEKAPKACVVLVCSFLEPASVCRLSMVSSKLRRHVSDAVWKDQVTRICETTYESEVAERHRLAKAGNQYMWMRSMPEITKAAMADLHVPTSPPKSSSSGESPSSPRSEREERKKELHLIGLGESSWYWKHQQQRKEARMGVGMPCMKEYYALERASDWRSRARVLCAKGRWCVVLFYDERVSASEAISQIHEATGRSTLGALWSALRIGNPLFGGNQHEGEVFWGTWAECRAVCDRLCRGLLLATVCPKHRELLVTGNKDAH